MVRQDSDQVYTVSTISQSLNVHETLYSYKDEMLGVFWSAMTFRVSVHGVHFTINLEHLPLL